VAELSSKENQKTLEKFGQEYEKSNEDDEYE